MPPKLLAANLFEYTLIAVGWWLVWRLQFSAKARPALAPLARPPIEAHRANVIAIGVLWALLTATLYTGYSFLTFVGGALFALFNIYTLSLQESARGQRVEPTPILRIAQTAGLTFVIVVSIVIPVQNLWEQILVRLHLPTDQQELIEIFKNAKTSGKLTLLTLNAVVFAPVTEELFFRAGLFRFLRGRLPRWAALLLPALIFASLHVDRTNLKGLITVAPLASLGIVFSIAYERTGRITVPILAHALFNLHTIVFILLGFDA